MDEDGASDIEEHLFRTLSKRMRLQMKRLLLQMLQLPFHHLFGTRLTESEDDYQGHLQDRRRRRRLTRVLHSPPHPIPMKRWTPNPVIVRFDDATKSEAAAAAADDFAFVAADLFSRLVVGPVVFDHILVVLVGIFSRP